MSRARIRATVKFISYEPALGPLSKLQLQPGGRVPDWIICGGESGTDARRIKPAWVRAVRDECADLGIAFFMKQIGDNHYGWPTNIRGKGHDMDDWPKDLRVRQFPSGKRASQSYENEAPTAIWSSHQNDATRRQNRRVFFVPSSVDSLGSCWAGPHPLR